MSAIGAEFSTEINIDVVLIVAACSGTSSVTLISIE